MNKSASKSSLSKIPKSSTPKSSAATEHRQSSPIVGRRFVSQPKIEIDNVTPMPTIREEFEQDESNESNKLSRSDERPTKTPDAKPNGKSDGKLDRKSADNQSSKFRVVKENLDRSLDKSTTAKINKKPSSIPSLGCKPRESKLINSLKSGTSPEQASRGHLHAPTLSSMNRQSLNRPQQFVKQPAHFQSAAKKESSGLLSGHSAMPSSLNLERVSDKTETDAGKNANDSLMTSGTNRSASNASNLPFQESKNELRNRSESESIKGNQINQDNPADEKVGHERLLAHEQHICRICLDSIQVDGDDLIDHRSSDVSADEPVCKPSIRRQPNYVSPCDCKGQSKYVHRKCLSEWIYVSKKTSCQVCLVKFRNIKIKVFKKSVMKWLADEYDHLLMLILYLIPFLIDCILIFNFLTYDMTISQTSSKTQLINSSKPVADLGTSSAALDRKQTDSQIESPLSQLEERLIITQNYGSKAFTSAPGQETVQSVGQKAREKTRSSGWNVLSSFISFKRTKNLSKSMSMSMFIYNLYFLELKIYVKNFSICLSGIPVTFLISLPSLLLFVRYCRSRYEEWQTENLEVSIDG